MSQNNLELNGDLHDHPLAELLVEIIEARLNGSLRISSEEHKTIIYFDAGDIVFAVSNARQHRLFSVLLRENKISSQQLSEIENFTNDLELKNALIESKSMSAGEINGQISLQIEEIVRTALAWKEGKWNYNPLVRARADMRFPVDLSSLLFEYGRALPNAALVRRFNSLQEKFETKTTLPVHINLRPQETFIFSRFNGESLSIEDIKKLSGASEIETLKTIYTLWLGGFLRRNKWNWAFSKEKLLAISSAKIALKKTDAPPVIRRLREEVVIPVEAEIQPAVMPEAAEELSLESYLERVENTASFYGILDVSSDAPTSEIKSAYFSLAKRFHPDLYYRQTDTEMHRRIQNAFTKLAHAYETLRDEKLREVYNFKLGKDSLVSQSKTKTDLSKDNISDLEKQAAESFEQGFTYLMNESYEEAIPFLARAVHLAGGNARYHAYYGKALANDKNTYRNAEAELQTALRIDPENTNYRFMIAELYVQIGLIKRAEGELNRVLEKVPNNWEARSLLDRLRNK